MSENSDIMASDWVARFADEVIAEADRRTPGGQIVCASGLSPSGPIHLGNLREVMTPHLVADEIRRRGRDCIHVLSWDDFDRFRKVPAGVAGVDASWNEHIGRPLTSVPAPPGSPYRSWAEHFQAPMIEAMALLGIEARGVSQTQMYTSGAYRDQILLAMRERARIDAVLGRYRTKKAVPTDEDDEDARAAAEGSGAAAEDDGASASGYFPYKPYCSVCDKDLTTVCAYDDETTELSYTCAACGHSETVKLTEHTHGKLVWKVDWPMRWAYEGVAFEPSGVDHTSPGSSFVVGTQLVSEVFGAPPPIGPMYAFVGISGMAKMSSSKGGVPTAMDALAIMEPALLRWLYARRRPNQGFKVAFDAEIQRMYDEWDALGRKVSAGTATPADAAAHYRATTTQSAGTLPQTPRPLPYRTLASIVDITTGDDAQTLRILRELDPERPIEALDQVRPRLDCAERWVTTQVPAEQRTQVRSVPDAAALAALTPEQRESLRLLLDGLAGHWSLEGLTTLVYGVPKQQLGLAPDVKPTPELKTAQRRFFALLYQLLVGRDTGPRLPTLLLAVGADRTRLLLSA
ncbi:MAG: lysine--tRNA ligase [Kineosporiaceae bacterium]